MNDFDDLDQLERDVGHALRTALRRGASQIRPEDMPRLDSGEILMGYVTSPSPERPLRDEHRRAPRRGAMLIGALSVAAAVVAVAVLDRPSHPAPPIQSPTTTSAPAPTTTTSPPVPYPYKSPVFLFDVATRTRTPLPSGLLEGFSPSGGYVPSPDGTRVAAIGCTPDTYPCVVPDSIAVGNIDGSNVRTIAPPDGTRLLVPGPSWSPDGTKIVYHARDDSTALIGELFIEDVATGAGIQLTHLELFYSGAFPLSPTFTPDGQSVLFMLPNSSRMNGSDVWSVPVTGGEPTLVIEHAAWPAPLPDGKSIAYVSESLSDIWVASRNDPGSARPVISTAAPVFGLWASPDGTKLLCGGVVVDIGTGAVHSVPNGGSAAWLDNETLILS